MIEKKKNTLTKITLLAVIILLIFLHYLNVLSVPENYIFNILGIGQNNAYGFLTKLKYSFVNYQEAQNLRIENKELKDEYNQLLYENSQLAAYKQENEKLRALVNFQEKNNFSLVTASVIGRDLSRVNTLLINKGSTDGLIFGLPVVVDNGIMIGKIIDVKDHMATVLLLTDNLSQLAVSNLDSQKTIGLAKGEYGLSLKVELIPQNIDIAPDNVVITSGLEQNIPRGLIIGKFNRILSQENELFKSATISPLIDYGEITVLSVVLPVNVN